MLYIVLAIAFDNSATCPCSNFYVNTASSFAQRVHGTMLDYQVLGHWHGQLHWVWLLCSSISLAQVLHVLKCLTVKGNITQLYVMFRYKNIGS